MVVGRVVGRTSSTPIPERPRMVTGGGQGNELYAALSRRLRIVEGGVGSTRVQVDASATTSGGGGGSIAETRVQSHSGSPSKSCRSQVRLSSCSLPSEVKNSRRAALAHNGGNQSPVSTPALAYPSPYGANSGTGHAGAPPPSIGSATLAGHRAAVAASSRFQQPSPQSPRGSFHRPSAHTPRQSIGTAQLAADRIWQRSGPLHCPNFAGGSLTTASNSFSGKHESGTPVNRIVRAASVNTQPLPDTRRLSGCSMKRVLGTSHDLNHKLTTSSTPPATPPDALDSEPDAEAKIASLSAELEAMRAKWQDEVKKRKDDAEQMRDLQSKSAGLQNDVWSLRDQLQTAKTQAVERLGGLLQRSYRELDAYKSQLEEEIVTHCRLDALVDEIRSEKRKTVEELQSTKTENESLRKQLQEFKAAEQVQRLRAGGLKSPTRTSDTNPENEWLLPRSSSNCTSTTFEPPSEQICSETRLRQILARTSGVVSTEDMSEAIASVEALVGEAKRELHGRQHREQRAAYEALHYAESERNEEVLKRTIAEARRTGVDAEDVQRAEATLVALQSLSVEERSAQAAKERLAKQKERAFLFVKRDDHENLRGHLEEVASEQIETSSLQWPSWKDHAGRTLLRCAQEINATQTYDLLRSLIPEKVKLEAKPILPNVERILPGLSRHGPVTPQTSCPEHSPIVNSRRSALEEPPHTNNITNLAANPETTPETSVVNEVEAEARTKAFRAVVKDDTATLIVTLDDVPVDTWSAWQNKAGKDLLTLSEERGSSRAYSVLARALGLLKDRHRDAFEEREAVWVLSHGEVQPRRATVVEETPPEVDTIFLEFWDGDEPPIRIDRSMVFKIGC